MNTSLSEIISATKLDPAAQNALEDHARYLLSTLPGQYTKVFVNPELPGKKIAFNTLKSIADDIHHFRLLDKHPIPSMLAVVAGNSTKERKHHEKIKAWVFLASLALIDRKAPVHAACRRIRRLAIAKDRWLLKDILRIDGGLKEIVSELNKLRESYSLGTALLAETIPEENSSSDSRDSAPETSKKKKVEREPDASKERKVAAIHVWLADLLYERQKRGPGPGGTTSLSLPSYVDRLVRTPTDNFQFPDIDGIEIVSDQQEIIAGGPGVESRSVGNRYLDSIADRAYPAFLKRRVHQGRELARTFNMRATASPCTWEGLSENEIQRTLSLCFDAAVSGCRASLWIVLSILLGRTPERLWSTPRQVYGETGHYGEFWRVTKKRIQLVSYLNLPDFGLGYRDSELMEPTYNCLLLSIPASLTDALRDALIQIWDERVSTDELRSELRSRTQHVNAKHNTRLTPNRLAAHLHRTIVHSGECDVVSKRLRGVDPTANYKQRYESCNQTVTQEIYRQYVEGLLRAIGRPGDWRDSQFKDQRFGTQMKVKDEAVRHLFAYLRQQAAIQNDPIDDILEFHNRYAMYVYHLLMLASGHRPVRVPLETIQSYDPVSHELFICDKVAQRTNDSRAVVLPNVACQQIDFYLEHLSTLERHCRHLAPETCVAIHGAQNGDTALLFRLERVDRTAWTANTFDPANVKRWQKDDWTLPLHWHRHWLRRKLARKKQPHEYVDQFMGHEDDQPSGLGRYSNLTYAGRHSLASCIETMLGNLGITAIGGLT